MNGIASTVARIASQSQSARRHYGLESVLGEAAWARLPQAVRERFGEPPVVVDYIGEFDVVRASRLGRMLAFICRLLGTPVVPRTGLRDLVRSTKIIDSRGHLVERLPARLCMPLDVYEQRGVLHFVSRGYYFDLGKRSSGGRMKLLLPSLLSPGTTHVEHIDEANGWFRFTMTVTHPLFGEMFYQTGRFRAAGEQS